MSESERANRLADRLHAVEDRLRAACQRSGRPREAVQLVAVTKTVSAEAAALLPSLGVYDLGESRPQELWHKAAVLPANVRWHLIGHLQRNKVERTLPMCTLIHAVDSVRLLEAIDEEAVKQGKSLDVLLEVNASRETSKHGFAPEEVASLAAAVRVLRQVRVRGLMTMAAPADDPERCRPTFAALRSLRDQLETELGQPHELPHLSMGMSGDFEAAVEEGATLVRIGSTLWEGIESP